MRELLQLPRATIYVGTHIQHQRRVRFHRWKQRPERRSIRPRQRTEHQYRRRDDRARRTGRNESVGFPAPLQLHSANDGAVPLAPNRLHRRIAHANGLARRNDLEPPLGHLLLSQLRTYCFWITDQQQREVRVQLLQRLYAPANRKRGIMC